MLAALTSRGFQIELHSHAEAILKVDFPAALNELEQVLGTLTIPIDDLIRSGGGEARHTQGMRRALSDIGWKKREFTIQKLIDGRERESISHEVDHVRVFDGGMVALEIEWNNKDPFFDRDLENFKRLHVEGTISVGVIVTRGQSLQDNMRELVRRFARERNIQSWEDLAPYIPRPTLRQQEAIQRRCAGGLPFPEVWAVHFCADKFGAATTHWRKLADRVRRGVGNPCPLLLIGIPEQVVQF